MSEARRAGILTRLGGQRNYIPASAVRRIVPLSRATRVPWSPLSMALVDGQVVCVVELGEPSFVLVLYELEGQVLALSGLTVERAGFYAGDAAGVWVDGEHVKELNLPSGLIANGVFGQ